MSLYAIHKQAAPPSGVSHCISARLTPSCLQQQTNATRIVRNLVTARSNYIQVFEVVEEVLGYAQKEEQEEYAIEVSEERQRGSAKADGQGCRTAPQACTLCRIIHAKLTSMWCAMQCIPVHFFSCVSDGLPCTHDRGRTASQTGTATARPYALKALQARPAARLQLLACSLSANTACTGQSPVCSGFRPSTRRGTASTGCSSPSRMQRCVES